VIRLTPRLEPEMMLVRPAKQEAAVSRRVRRARIARPHLDAAWRLDDAVQRRPGIPQQIHAALHGRVPLEGRRVMRLAARVLAVGVWPAVRFSRPAVLGAVSRGSGSGEPRVGRLHRVAASAQIAIALLFLATCALFVRAVDGLGTRDFGFVPHNLLTVELDLAAQGYDTLQPGQAFLDRVSESVAALPGVTSVAYADGIPMDLVGNFVSISRADRAGEVNGDVLAEFTSVGHNWEPPKGRFCDRSCATPSVLPFPV
jgi:hypothetical protein